MQVITDLQLHSKYSRAVSPQMLIPYIWDWAKIKGIGLIATGDWTHPLWMREIKANLEEDGSGLLKLKDEKLDVGSEKWDKEVRSGINPLFLLATEVSSIYSQGGKGRRVHTLIWTPTIDSADKITKEFIKRGANLYSDGRPIIGLSSIEVAELVFTIDPASLIIPAHAWTPWFSLYGSKSGFDSIDECYGQFGKNIYAIETGLSSDPSMNWRIKELDNRSIVSFSDAHSGPKLGREATVFELEQVSYTAIREAISQIRPIGQIGIGNKIAYTIEFYPEEGKYHYTGHRDCGIKQTPVETKQKGTVCPVCGRILTVGVMHRVEELAARSEEDLKLKTSEISGTKIKGIFSDTFPGRPPFIKLVPLQEIIAEVFGGLPTAQKTQDEYKKLVDNFGSEFKVLLETSLEDITKISGPKISDALHKVRTGDIFIDPGYDGVFGKVKIWNEEKKQTEEQKEQMSLF